MQVLESAGGSIRTNRNMLVFLVPDATKLALLRGTIRRHLALEEIIRSPSFKEMDAEDREQVREQAKEKKQISRTFSARCTRRCTVPMGVA